ncbi:MAG: hypothetical protein A2138_21475 [Deltaproteobacteria bacterium RBG_16_71_12]|nr:MAG: hypothetical protein A2138_21475 [Deltaproteobacteria bacterium RBG_16_71_12]
MKTATSTSASSTSSPRGLHQERNASPISKGQIMRPSVSRSTRQSARDVPRENSTFEILRSPWPWCFGKAASDGSAAPASRIWAPSVEASDHRRCAPCRSSASSSAYKCWSVSWTPTRTWRYCQSRSSSAVWKRATSAAAACARSAPAMGGVSMRSTLSPST